MAAIEILLVGATRRLGAAVGGALTGCGHQVVTVGRTAGDVRADVADPEQTARVFAEVGNLDVPVRQVGGGEGAELQAGLRPRSVGDESTDRGRQIGHAPPAARWGWRPAR